MSITWSCIFVVAATVFVRNIGVWMLSSICIIVLLYTFPII